MKLVSWNVNGIRSVLGKGFHDFLGMAQADIICLQETKAREEQVTATFDGYKCYWNSAQKAGYSGTAIFSKKEPLEVRHGIGHDSHDTEGRVLTAEYPEYYVVNVYVPNSKRELTRLDYRVNSWGPDFLGFLEELEKKKPVIFCGDLNVAHKEIDIARPKANVGNAGFTPEERASFDTYIGAGFVDSFREIVTEGNHYTWWSYQSDARARNIGWRIDYVCLSPALRPALKDAFIWPQVLGSDHCPVGVVLDVA
ncbi:exodeoxyribonuclease III [soil metagenome]